MGLDFTADFLHTFPIKIFLIKNSIKWPSFNISRKWPSVLKITMRTGRFSIQTSIGTQLAFS